MGGNALKFETGRLTANEFKPFEQFVVNRLSPYFNQIKPTQYYSDKESFGDLDVLVEGQLGNQTTKELINQLFRPNQIFKNGNVYSFDISNFQVDLIFHGKENFNSAYFYFSYNDLNNLVGKLYHKMNLKFGHKGLAFMLFTDDTHLKKEVNLCKDPEMIYQLIGLDFDQFKQGFKNREEIFEFVISSDYFEPGLFSLQNLTHKDRTRDKKRKTYQMFLEFVEQKFNIDLNQVEPLQKFTKQQTLEFIDQHFPEVGIFYIQKQMNQKNRERKAIADKFNGNIVHDLTGRQDKEIGDLIKAVKNELSDRFNSYILESPQSHIEQMIFDFDQKLKHFENN